ncbi:hypothetical protein CRP01_03645 [Flavilitoribacter nigricans DSM 23189 = NBRC 102662]|uniref:Uncharacterized protein n=1 Tax=Flavilitoribacter nigricans (strain ATCC 23147 / DSM 23189 / NBRC 102662 / NCIMB 1420 / SS-2) TaxID=1122177 RepID=A0A2D0NH93_FLAN2|nr:hypothetical protein CRP01_03645 [Flavilitoribacter nigricans DSM 23189 = NBRC 102662]
MANLHNQRIHLYNLRIPSFDYRQIRSKADSGGYLFSGSLIRPGRSMSSSGLFYRYFAHESPDFIASFYE